MADLLNTTRMLNAECPICGGSVALSDLVEVSEILTCTECGNRVVVEELAGGRVTLKEAPKVEEDWGE